MGDSSRAPDGGPNMDGLAISPEAKATLLTYSDWQTLWLLPSTRFQQAVG